MEFYIIFSSILLPPPGKWVPLGRTVEGSFEKRRLLRQRPMAPAMFPSDKAAILEYEAPCKEAFFRRERDGMNSPEPTTYLKVFHSQI